MNQADGPAGEHGKLGPAVVELGAILPIYECVWMLPSGRPCGYVQRGPGNCPYAHPEPQLLVRYRSLLAVQLVAAVEPLLAAYRSTGGHVTEEQVTAAWAAYDAARAHLRQDEVEHA